MTILIDLGYGRDEVLTGRECDLMTHPCLMWCSLQGPIDWRGVNGRLAKGETWYIDPRFGVFTVVVLDGSKGYLKKNAPTVSSRAGDPLKSDPRISNFKSLSNC